MGKFFGTDGIRGIVNQNLTCDLALKVAIATTYILGKNPTILIGKDPRISSDMLESSLIAGIISMGGNVLKLGFIPTPAVSYLVKKYNADAGIMISASHNSFEFNGIKIFNKDGYKLSDEMEEKIESLISKDLSNLLVDACNIGKIENLENAKDDYIEHILHSIPITESKIKVLVDCSNGSSSFTAKKLFKSLKINADFIFDTPNGININNKCGSTNIDKLCEFVKKGNYDLAVAFDGDADRCLAVDEKGNIIDGDKILAIFANYMKKFELLNENTLVGTVMSNLGLKNFCKENNINFYQTKVGDRYVLEKMLESNYILGGEQSGHIILKNYMSTGDGELTAVKLIQIMTNTNTKASKLNELFKKYPQKCSQIDIKYNQKDIIVNDKELNEYILSENNKLKSFGRILVRPSGTEPKIRIMVEHEDESKIDNIIDEISKKIQKILER